jgi:hypothetical protein
MTTDVTIQNTSIQASVTSNPPQEVVIQIPASVVSEVSSVGLQGPQGSPGEQGPAGPPGSSDIGGYAVSVGVPLNGDYLGFFDQLWVNTSVTDGGNF